METLHLAYSTVDGDGISRDVALLLDADQEGPLMVCGLMDRITSFFRAADLIGQNELVTNIIR